MIIIRIITRQLNGHIINSNSSKQVTTMISIISEGPGSIFDRASMKSHAHNVCGCLCVSVCVSLSLSLSLSVLAEGKHTKQSVKKGCHTNMSPNTCPDPSTKSFTKIREQNLSKSPMCSPRFANTFFLHAMCRDKAAKRHCDSCWASVRWLMVCMSALPDSWVYDPVAMIE